MEMCKLLSGIIKFKTPFHGMAMIKKICGGLKHEISNSKNSDKQKKLSLKN